MEEYKATLKHNSTNLHKCLINIMANMKTNFKCIKQDLATIKVNISQRKTT